MNIKFSDFEKSNISLSESDIKILTPLLNINFIFPCIFIAGGIRLLEKSGIYLVPAVFVLVLALYWLWNNYNSINVITIDMKEKYFIISSRNPLKRIFIKNKKIKFNEIRRFIVNEDYGFTKIWSRFIISAVGNDSLKISFTQSLNKNRALNISSFLNQALTSNRKF